MKSNSINLETGFKLQWTWFLLIVSIWIIWIYSLPLDPDYSAGEMRDVYLSWFETGTLYSSIDHFPYRVLNYPPLFFYLVLLLNKMGIPYFLAGRMLSTSFGIFGFIIFYRWLRNLNIPSLQAKFVLALFTTSFPILYHLPQFYLQWPAITLSFYGMYLLSKPSSSFRIIAAGIACAMACFFKQTQVITGFIAFLWLFTYARPKSWIYLITTLFVGSIGLALLELKFGKSIWLHLFTYTIGTFSFHQLLVQLFCHLCPWIFFFGMGIYRSFKEKDERSSLLNWYFIGSSLWLLSSSRLGASSQYFMEWNFATLLWSAPTLLDLISRPKAKFWKFLLFLQIFLAGLGFPGLVIYDALELQKLKSKLPLICHEISSSTVPIPSDSPGLIRACGKIPALHPFIMDNLAQKNLWNKIPFVQKIEEKDFPYLVLSFNPQDYMKIKKNERWDITEIESILKNYGIKNEILEWRIFEPRRLKPGEATSP